MRKERLGNLTVDVGGGSERQRYSDELVLPDCSMVTKNAWKLDKFGPH